MAIFFFIPAYIMYVIGGMAMQAGLATTAMSILGVFLGPILGRAIAKSGNARNIMTAGTMVRIAVTLVFIFFLSPATPLVLIYAIMFIGGFYSSQTGVSFATAPQIQIKAEIRQLSNSVIQVGQGFGAGIGLSVYTLIIGGYGIVDGMKIALGLAVIAAGIALFLGLGLKLHHEYAMLLTLTR